MKRNQSVFIMFSVVLLFLAGCSQIEKSKIPVKFTMENEQNISYDLKKVIGKAEQAYNKYLEAFAFGIAAAMFPDGQSEERIMQAIDHYKLSWRGWLNTCSENRITNYENDVVYAKKKLLYWTDRLEKYENQSPLIVKQVSEQLLGLAMGLDRLSKKLAQHPQNPRDREINAIRHIMRSELSRMS